MKFLRVYTIFLLILAIGTQSAKADTIDNFQIYIKKVLRMNDSGFGSATKETNHMVLTKAVWTDTLAINYNHCTAGARQRRIKLITESKKVIFEWTFPDEEMERMMSISIGQLLSIIQPKVKTGLYYFDEQTSNGSYLTTLEIREM